MIPIIPILRASDKSKWRAIDYLIVYGGLLLFGAMVSGGIYLMMKLGS